MSLFAYIGGSDQAHKIRLGDFGLSARADGTGAFGQIIFDDPTGALTVRGFQTVKIVETACVDAPVLHWGYIWVRDYTRALGRVDGSRTIDCQILDPNYVLNHRLITGLDGKRDAETDIERIDWLLNSTYLSGLISDFGLVNRASPHPMEEANYIGQHPSEVLQDLCGQLFKTFFAYWNQAEAAVGLFYDLPTSTAGTSTLTISNVLGDVTRDVNGTVTGTCFPPSIDGSLNRDPSEVYSVMRFKYRNGVVLGHNTDTYDTFFADTGLGQRGVQVESIRVGQESTARSRIQTLLGRDANEADTITVSIEVPSTQVGLIDAGQRIGVCFSHLPGYETQTFTRVTARTIHQITDVLYRIDLELNAQGITSGAGGGGGDPGDFPHQPPACDGSLVQWKSATQNSGSALTVTLDDPPTEGNLLVLYAWGHAVPPDLNAPSGFTATPLGQQAIPHGGTSSNSYGSLGLYYRIAETGDSASVTMTGLGDRLKIVLAEFGGSFELADSDQHSTATFSGGGSIANNLGTVTLTGASLVVGLGGWEAGQDVTFSIDRGTIIDGSTAPVGAGIGPEGAASYEMVSTAGSVSPTMHAALPSDNGGTLGFLAAFACTSSTATNPPSPAQAFGPITPVETPDAVIKTFTMPAGYEFADGSLKVFVNRLDQTAAVVSYDGACREFTLSFAPWVGDVIEVYGIGR